MMKERRARAGFDVNANEITEAMNEGKFGKGVAKLLNKDYSYFWNGQCCHRSGGAAFLTKE